MTGRGTSRGFTLPVHVQPRAQVTEIVGWHGDALKIRVKAPPVDGAANGELIRFLAQRLNLSKDAILMAAGPTGRRKRLRVVGLSFEQAVAMLGVGSAPRSD